MLLLALLVGAVPLRYDLAPGDRLVYRQTLRRERTGTDTHSVSETTWTSQVLVLSEKGGLLSVGIQRNRDAARLVAYEESGKDQLARESRSFDERRAREAPGFAEANRVTRAGLALLPWAAVREAGSELLPFVHELTPLPEAAGAPWAGQDDLGLTYRESGMEGASTRITAQAPQGAGLSLSLLFDGERRIVGRLDLEARYAALGGQLHETLHLELVDRTRGEGVEAWLGRPETRLGALQGLLASEAVSLDAGALRAVLADGDAASQRLALALIHRDRLPLPTTVTLARLLAGPDPRVRALSARLLERVPAPEAAPLLAQAAKDADAFVRRAAADAARASGAARAVSCEAPDRAGQALAARRTAGQVAGTTLRHMTTAPFAGRPYAVRVPEDYRGDAPFPLVVVLSGGPGHALTAALGAEPVIAPTGYVAVYPEAGGMWWEPQPTAMVAALVDEVLAAFDVDTNRVYLTGFSNGGTGALLYATLMPDRFAALVPMMGGGVPFFQAAEPLALRNVVRLPMLLIHGKDDTIIPSYTTVETVKALKKADPAAPVESRIFEGKGHEITLGSDEGLTLPFLEAHARDPFPRAVSLQARSLDHARNRWVEVLEKDGGLAEVEGEISGDVVRLTTKRVKRLRLRLRRELLAGSGRVSVVLDGRPAFEGPFVEDCALLASSGAAAHDPYLGYAMAIELAPKR